MATSQATLGIFGELAELFADSPKRDAILAFRPSKNLQKRATSLLSKRNRGKILTQGEERELDEFVQAELFMGLLKAKVRSGSDQKP